MNPIQVGQKNPAEAELDENKIKTNNNGMCKYTIIIVTPIILIVTFLLYFIPSAVINKYWMY